MLEMKSLAVLLLVTVGVTHGLTALLLAGYGGGQIYSPFSDDSKPLELNFNHLGYGKMLNINSSAYYLGGMTKDHLMSEKVYIHIADSHDTLTGKSLPLPLIGMAAAANGTEIYMCGGATASKAIATTACFKLKADGSAWVPLPSYPEAIAYASMVMLNGSPYVFGGSRADGPDDVVVTDSVYMLAGEKKWIKMKSMPSAAAYMGKRICRRIDFKPYIAGSTPFKLKPPTKAAPSVGSGQALLCGGWVTPNGKRITTGSCNLYDAAGDKWIEVPQLNEVRAYGTLSFFGARLYAVSGWGTKDYQGLLTAEVFDPIARSWQTLSNTLKFADAASTAISYKVL